MNKNLTDITVILDRSGSMLACKEEAENGVNHFVEEQKKEDGETLFSLVQFDSEYEFVHKNISIQDVPKFTLVPRNMTALLDAVGRTINDTGDRLSKMNEEDRPNLVIFLIVTDGLENASHEFTKAQIKELIQTQQNDYKWQFTFLGANQDAFAEANGLGIPDSSIANYNVNSSQKAFYAASNNVSRMRSSSVSGRSVVSSYTDEERSEMQ